MEKSRRLLIGIFIAVIGMVLLLFNLGLVPYSLGFLKSWQMLLIALGVFNFLNGKRVPGILLIAVGAFFLIEFYTVISIRRFLACATHYSGGSNCFP